MMSYIQQSKMSVKRANALFLFTTGRLYLRLMLPLCIVLIIGCNGDTLTKPRVEVLEIQALTIEPQSLEIENTASVSAAVNYSGSLNALGYTWTTTGGEIIVNTTSVTYVAPNIVNTTSVTYVAPNKAGTYTIRLRVTDGTLSVTKEIAVEVTLGPAIVWQ